MRVGALLALAWTAAASLLLASACDPAGEPVPFAHLGLTLAHPAFLERPMPVTGAESPDLARVAAAARDRTAGSTRGREPGAAHGRAPRHAPVSPAASAGARGAMSVPYHVELRARGERGLRLEIRIERAPQQPRTALGLSRSLRHGASLAVAEVASAYIHGRLWQRTRFLHATGQGLATGIEHAALAGPYLYRVTAYGPSGAAEALAERVGSTLRLDGDAGPMLAPVEEPDGAPAAVQRAASAVVAVIAADVTADSDDAAHGRLTPVAVGSGVVVDSDGHVLTSLHTLHDQERDRLHDLFLIGREGMGGVMLFTCAGRPAHGRLERALDLALIRCELDMSGAPFQPSGWAALGVEAVPAPAAGTPLWALGFARADDGVLRARAGRALGPSRPGADPEQGLAIDVPITPGMSGGAVVDQQGALAGVVQGFRARFEADHAGIREIGRIGLVRPARDARLLAPADRGALIEAR